MEIPLPTDLRGEVEDALVGIRGALTSHGGDVELVEVTSEGVVIVRLTGACAGCPMADMTVSGLIEETLREHVPGITAVVNEARR